MYVHWLSYSMICPVGSPGQSGCFCWVLLLPNHVCKQLIQRPGVSIIRRMRTHTNSLVCYI